MSKLDKFIGKDNIKENLSVFIESSKINNKLLDHILIYGQPGMGKTTLAKIIAEELGTKIKIVQGPEIQTRMDILNIIYYIKEGNVLFIDEIHSVNKSCFEIIYNLMDEFKININIGKEGNRKISSIDVPKFTLIGATTLLGNLSDPFEDRFGINIHLTHYTNDEIVKILKMENTINNILESDLNIIASNSKGVPRIAKKIFNRVIDFRINNKYEIKDILKKLNIYEHGVNEVDILYLKLLYKDKLSLKTLSQTLFIDEKTILNKIEPYLFKIGFINKSSKGRKITDKGIDFLHKNKFIVL